MSMTTFSPIDRAPHSPAKDANGLCIEGFEQGLYLYAGGGVCRAELPGSGSRSAFFLVHAELSGGGLGLESQAARSGEKWWISTGIFIKSRMLSQADYERPVT